MTDTPPAATWIAPLLEGWANQIAARFCAPVYLVGSALAEEHPRDVDIRVVLTDQAFLQRYGCSCIDTQFLGGGPALADIVSAPEVVRFWKDMAKLGQWCSDHHGAGKAMNIDFQVQDVAVERARRHHEKPRIRLDKLGDFA